MIRLQNISAFETQSGVMYFSISLVFDERAYVNFTLIIPIHVYRFKSKPCIY